MYFFESTSLCLGVYITIYTHVVNTTSREFLFFCYFFPTMHLIYISSKKLIDMNNIMLYYM
ncbi:hypothetical protein EDC94DRAFT_619699 [Helicostylum pulchrum]|nr:hypothetical protein EDC94DRAFT_619699 [Helicostylum pulchrum]